MSSVSTRAPILLPAAEETVTDEFVVLNNAYLSAPQLLDIEPVGATFIQLLRYRIHGASLNDALSKLSEEKDDQNITTNENAEEETDLSYDDEVTPELMHLDLADWKKHDHYAIIGLPKLRWAATDAQIRNAYRRRVLKYHPDKKAQSDNATSGKPKNPDDDHFFKCVQKSYELLSDPVRRRQYDSVDSYYSDEIPDRNDKSEFFSLYGPVFEREARFSKKQPVPLLGDDNTPQEEVEQFYNFWYNFDSWRSFEFLDKEDLESAENREEKRWLERQNRDERQRRKREDMARIRRLVDQAFKRDPRIKRFKELQKQELEAKKQAKEQAARLAREDEERARLEAQRAKEKAEQEERERAAAEKKQREALKSKLRKGRKAVKALLKERPLGQDAIAGPATTEIHYAVRDAQLDTVLDKLDVDKLAELKQRLEADASSALGQQIINEVVRELVSTNAIDINSVDRLVSADVLASKMDQASTPKQATESTKSKSDASKLAMREWTPEEIAVLIKAVKKFPGGSRKRWETISEYVAAHSGQPARSNDELIAKAKELQQGANAIQENAVRQLQFSKKHADTRINDEPSVRIDGPSTAPVKAEKTVRQWTNEEQRQLEAALKKYPASWKGEGDRWDHITALVPGRTKREVKLRVKFLIEQINAKKSGAN